MTEIVRCQMARRYTHENYEEVLRLHALGYGRIRISRKTGIPTETVYEWYGHGRKPFGLWTEEEKIELNNKISESMTGSNHPNFGKHLPTETKRKIAETKMESKNPMWKGDEASKYSGRGRARRRYDPPEGYEIHHIDGNSFNNVPSNIQFVTRKQHMIEDGRREDLIKRNKEGHSLETLRKISGKNNGNWKGDKASDRAKRRRPEL